MRNIIYTILIGSALVSCETRLDPLEKINKTPVFSINGSLNSWVDSENVDYSTSIVDSVKSGWDYWVNYKIEEEQKSIYFSTDGYFGRTQINELTINDTTRIETGEGKFKYSPYFVGLNDFNYTVIDRYDELSSVNVKLVCFDNLKPVALFSVEHLGVNSPYEYKIDGSQSYDRDAKFGGTITRYRLIIDNDTMYQPNAIFNYHFNSTGTYAIRMQVLDNNDVFSELNEIIYNVQ